MYVLPVLWMSSRFHVIVRIERNQTQRYVSSCSPGSDTGAKLLSTIAGLLALCCFNILYIF